MGKKILQESSVKFVIASLDASGKTVYLHSLHDHKWEITDKIEHASKTLNRATARMVLDGYKQDIKNDDEFVIIPLVTEYYLVNESGE